MQASQTTYVVSGYLGGCVVWQMIQLDEHPKSTSNELVELKAAFSSVHSCVLVESLHFGQNDSPFFSA